MHFFFVFYFLIFPAKKESLSEEGNFYAIYSVQAKKNPQDPECLFFQTTLHKITTVHVSRKLTFVKEMFPAPNII